MIVFAYTGEDLKPTVVGPPSGWASRTPVGVLFPSGNRYRYRTFED